MKNSLETKLGIFVVLVIFAAIFIVEVLGDFDFLHGSYRVSALFDTAQDLKVGDSVKMAGVEIGRVENIALTDQKVKVTMKLDSDAIVKTDSEATIKFTGLMGQNFVAIDFGSPNAPRVVNNAVLETREQPDLSAIMDKLNKAATGIANFGNSFTGDKIDNLVGPLTDFIKQNSGHISDTISNIENISGQIAAGRGTVGKLIYNNSLYNSALTTVTNLQGTVTEVRQVVSGVGKGQGTLGKLVTDSTLYDSMTASMTNLSQIMLKINQGQGTVGKLVNDQEFYKNAKLSLQKLDTAADSLEDQGPLTVIGIVANNLF
jgi:phospholipid/cholesterol/gamma-HCH transport system substrate-binding protein